MAESTQSSRKRVASSKAVTYAYQQANQKLKALFSATQRVISSNDIDQMKEHGMKLKKAYETFRSRNQAAVENAIKQTGCTANFEVETLDGDRGDARDDLKSDRLKLNKAIEALGRTPLTSINDPSEYAASWLSTYRPITQDLDGRTGGRT